MLIGCDHQVDPKDVEGSIEGSQNCYFSRTFTVLTFFQKGCHDIENELIFQSNQGFVFHDSRGFQAGSEDEMEVVKNFVADRAATIQLEKRVHAIW